MLTYDMLRQLAPSPIGRIRNQYRFAERPTFPTRLSFLAQYEVDEETIAALRGRTTSEEEERILVAYILLSLFEGEHLHARSAIACWLRRKGGQRQDLKEVAQAFAAELIEKESSERPNLPAHNANAEPVGCCA